MADPKTSELDHLLERRRELQQRGRLLESHGFQEFIAAKQMVRTRLFSLLRTTRMDDYTQGLMHGRLEILDELSMDRPEIEAKLAEIDAKILDLQESLESVENRQWRDPPPSLERPAPPYVRGKSGIRLDMLAPPGG